MSYNPIFRFAIREDLKVDADAQKFLPTKGTSHSTGWDVRAAEDLIVYPDEYFKIRLGFRVFAPEGWWLDIHPRSSTFVKKHVHALYGVIDEDYEGECSFCGQYITEGDIASKLEIKRGDAIGQLIPIKRQDMHVEEVSNEEYDRLCKERNAQRGAGGFGSTGK